MQASPRTERPPRWRAWLPRLLAVAVLLAAGGLALVRLDVIGGPTEAERTAAITTELNERMTTTLEQLPAEGHHGHAAAATTAQSRTVCGTRVYGYEPFDAPDADAVDTVYGFHFCAVAEPGGTWDFASKLVAPLVMHTDRQPPTFEMASATEQISYHDRIKQIIPPRYQQLAREGALEPQAMADLRARFEAAVKG